MLKYIKLKISLSKINIYIFILINPIILQESYVHMTYSKYDKDPFQRDSIRDSLKFKILIHNCLYFFSLLYIKLNYDYNYKKAEVGAN